MLSLIISTSPFRGRAGFMFEDLRHWVRGRGIGSAAARAFKTHFRSAGYLTAFP